MRCLLPSLLFLMPTVQAQTPAHQSVLVVHGRFTQWNAQGQPIECHITSTRTQYREPLYAPPTKADYWVAYQPQSGADVPCRVNVLRTEEGDRALPEEFEFEVPNPDAGKGYQLYFKTGLLCSESVGQDASFAAPTLQDLGGGSVQVGPSALESVWISFDAGSTWEPRWRQDRFVTGVLTLTPEELRLASSLRLRAEGWNGFQRVRAQLTVAGQPTP